jgi:8-oxo-dGTP diphosphatase
MTGSSAPEVVVLLLYDADGRVLLQKRSDDAPYLPGTWAFFGGSVETGESLQGAALRESLEELNYAPQQLQSFSGGSFLREGAEVRLHVFHQQFTGSKKDLQLLEGQDWGWFSRSELAPRDLHPRDLAILATFYLKIDAEPL